MAAPPICTFAAAKGGVGKSTLTANTARCLTKFGMKVLVIDLDPQGSVSRFLADATEESQLNRLASIQTQEQFDDEIRRLKAFAVPEDQSVLALMDGKPIVPLVTHGVHLVGYAHRFNARLKELEDNETQPRFMESFDRLVQQEQPDVVLVDTQPANTSIAQFAVHLGTHMICPAELTGEGIRGVVMADALRGAFNKNFERNQSPRRIQIAGVVPMGFTQTKIANAALSCLKTRFGSLVTSKIDAANIIRVACSEGVPVIDYEARVIRAAPAYAVQSKNSAERFHKSGRQFMQVAGEIGTNLGLLQRAPEEPKYDAEQAQQGATA